MKYIDPDGNSSINVGNCCGGWNPVSGIGDGIARAFESTMNKIGDGIKNVGEALISPLVAASNYLKEGGGGFNFYSKNGGGGDPGRKGGRDTEMVNADPILQAAGYAKSATGPQKNPKNYVEVADNVLTVTGNTIEGLDKGGKLAEKYMEVTAQFADGYKTTDGGAVIQSYKNSTITVEAGKEKDFYRAAENSREVQNSKVDEILLNQN